MELEVTGRLLSTEHGSRVTRVPPVLPQVMEALQKENRDLRAELEELSKRVSKVAVLEEEMSKIHSAYQE